MNRHFLRWTGEGSRKRRLRECGSTATRPCLETMNPVTNSERPSEHFCQEVRTGIGSLRHSVWRESNHEPVPAIRDHSSSYCGLLGTMQDQRSAQKASSQHPRILGRGLSNDAETAKTFV